MFGSASLTLASTPFDEPAALAAVLVETGALSAPPFVRESHLAEALVMRSAVRRCLLAALNREPLPHRDVETINSFASDEPPAIVLRADGTIVKTASEPVRCALAAIARDAAEVIATRTPLLRTCDRPGCEAIYLDASRGKRRRWCSMRRCGNRAKIAAYRARERRQR